MFTGLIEGLGRIVDLQAEQAGIRITVAPAVSISKWENDNNLPTQCGDSIAINGCCLTVVSIEAGHWSFQAGRETLSKTNLGNLVVGDAVNLERSLRVNGQLGGHFVQGHVDGIGTVDQLDPDATWVTMGFKVSAELAELMVSKGSIAVDGISLTIVDVETNRFTVALIPHTLSITTLGRRSVGDVVNIETDILGKYVRKLMSTTR